MKIGKSIEVRARDMVRSPISKSVYDLVLQTVWNIPLINIRYVIAGRVFNTIYNPIKDSVYYSVRWK